MRFIVVVVVFGKIEFHLYANDAGHGCFWPKCQITFALFDQVRWIERTNIISETPPSASDSHMNTVDQHPASSIQHWTSWITFARRTFPPYSLLLSPSPQGALNLISQFSDDSVSFFTPFINISLSVPVLPSILLHLFRYNQRKILVMDDNRWSSLLEKETCCWRRVGLLGRKVNCK